ncbi:RNA-directed DNA polymerase from mobile element jockey [Pitangus sulphuratus]|nr:RNA-directed DNA polymerase from mobile element jockey [Pitangus sulphuratus]
MSEASSQPDLLMADTALQVTNFQECLMSLHKDLLLHLDLYKSMGPDGIHLRILKALADTTTKPPSMIFEQSQESREVPADWKLPNVVPIFKKDKKQNPGNYRPISLTSVPSKVLEKIILGGVEKH